MLFKNFLRDKFVFKLKRKVFKWEDEIRMLKVVFYYF